MTAPATHRHTHYVLLMLAAVLFVLLDSDMALARTTVSVSDFDYALCKVARFANGNLGKGLASLGIITLGIGAMMAKVSWGMAIMVGVGIAALFSAPGLIAAATGVVGICV